MKNLINSLLKHRQMTLLCLLSVFVFSCGQYTVIDEMFSELAWKIQHGTRDEHLSYKQMQEQLDDGLKLKCGPTSNFVKYLLNKQGVKSRIVRIFDPEPLESNYANGHVMLEVLTDHGWIVYDINGNTNLGASVLNRDQWTPYPIAYDKPQDNTELIKRCTIVAIQDEAGEYWWTADKNSLQHDQLKTVSQEEFEEMFYAEIRAKE